MRATALPISQTTTREESATLLRLGRILNFMKSLALDEIHEIRAAIRSDPKAVQNKIKEICAARCDAPEANKKISHVEKRMAAGKLLLGLFLQDGLIRGITPEGDTFNHRASHELCILFRDGILLRK